MARVSILFDGFEDLAYELDRLQGESLHDAVDESLEAAQDYIQERVERASSRYGKGGGKGYASGRMKEAVYHGGVKWSGSTAEVGVGFSLDQPAGYHSIFIMYGTPRHGPGSNRGIAADKHIYNAMQGKGINAEIERRQIAIMEKYLTLGGRK